MKTCDDCKYYEWYYDWCNKWKTEHDARNIEDCFEPREEEEEEKE